MVSDVRVRPIVRIRRGGEAWWYCELCTEISWHVGTSAWAHDDARRHYREMHVPGLQRIERALRDLPAEPPAEPAPVQPLRVSTVEDYPAPRIPWRWLLLTLGVALVVAAAVLILADVVPWHLGVIP